MAGFIDFFQENLLNSMDGKYGYLKAECSGDYIDTLAYIERLNYKLINVSIMNLSNDPSSNIFHITFKMK